MNKEIRVYYECLEQANDYLLRMIRKVVPNGSTITLVKMPRNARELFRGSMASIFSLTTPDVLFTGIEDGIEYPLAILEFSEAVTTEDHELQRTYGAVAAYLSCSYYIKVSGQKESGNEFGGAEYNPYSTPKILKDTFNYEGYIIADWNTESDNAQNLQRNAELPACPPMIPILQETLRAAIKSFLQSKEDWFSRSLKALKQTASYKNFHDDFTDTPGANKLLQAWKEREKSNGNLNRLRHFVRGKWIGAKINRFSHAMDPDRGILTFISFVFSNAFKIYGIYALVRQKGDETLKTELTSLATLRSKLKAAIEMDSGGIPEWFQRELISAANKAKKHDETINFQPVWEKYKNKISENKVVATIAYFLDGMLLNHNGIKLTWDRRKLLGDTKGEFLSLLSNYLSSAVYSAPSPITEVTQDVDEDEVTYAITHRVLIPNGFRIVSISYPGSQGGGAILPEPTLGKAQPREYPDIIALPPAKTSELDVVLNESKGMFQQAGVERDLKKVARYKHDKKLQFALKETLIAAKVIDRNNKIRNILIGVAFGVASNTTTSWKPSEVDFIFRIVDRKKWAIGIFNQALRNMVSEIEGETNLPVVHRIAPKNVEDGN